MKRSGKKIRWVIMLLVLMTASLGQSEQISIATAQTEEIESIISRIPRPEFNESETEWSTPQYEMLLITPDDPAFIAEAEPLASWKTARGIPCTVVSNYSSYGGVDTQEKIRNAIISYRARYPIQWVLLMGDTDKIPIRYIYNPDGATLGTSEAVGDPYLKPTDFYYAELTGNWNIDGDGQWGEDAKYNEETGENELDYIPEVYLGRFPADSAAELKAMVNKTIFYEQGGNAGDWMNRYLAASGISDYPYYKDLNGEDEAVLNQYIIDNYVGTKMNWGHLLEHTSCYTPPDSPKIAALTRWNMYTHLNLGCSIAVWAGHGRPEEFTAVSAGIGMALHANDVTSLTNTNMFTFLVGDACSTNAYDYDTSIGEKFIKQPTTGGIGYIGAMRISWYYPNDTSLAMLNRGVTKQLFYEMFIKGYYQQGKALYESKISYVNSPWFKSLTPDSQSYKYIETERKILTSYMLLGDPTVDIYTDVPKNFSSVFDGSQIFEGEEFTLVLKDINGTRVPYARITFTSDDGKFKSFEADSLGQVTVKFPIGERSYNYSVIGHNMNAVFGNFSVIPDNYSPMFGSDPEITPNPPTTDKNPVISEVLRDSESGIEDAYVLLTQNHFGSFESYAMERVGDTEQFQAILPKPDVGDYEWAVVVFDNANNWNSTLLSGVLLQYSVSLPTQWYLALGLNIGLIGLVGVSIPLVWKKYRKLIIPVASGKGDLGTFDEFLINS